MRKVKTIEINGLQLTLQELTVGEVINQIENGESGLPDLMFTTELPLDLVAACAGLKKDELTDWYPADLKKLISEVETVNPHCARVCQKLAEITGQINPEPPKNR